MKGPSSRLRTSVLREWACPSCGSVVRLPGSVTARWCHCSDPSVGMKLRETARPAKIDVTQFLTTAPDDEEADVETVSDEELFGHLAALYPERKEEEAEVEVVDEDPEDGETDSVGLVGLDRDAVGGARRRRPKQSRGLRSDSQRFLRDVSSNEEATESDSESVPFGDGLEPGADSRDKKSEDGSDGKPGGARRRRRGRSRNRRKPGTGERPEQPDAASGKTKATDADAGSKPKRGSEESSSTAEGGEQKKVPRKRRRRRPRKRRSGGEAGGGDSAGSSND